MSHQKVNSIYGFFGIKPDACLLDEELGVPLFDDRKKQCGVIFSDTQQFNRADDLLLAQETQPISWNSNSQILSLKRDYSGLETIFYLQKDQTVFFSTELKKLLKLTVHIPKKFFFYSLLDLILFGRIAAPYTLYEGIKHLYPGKIHNLQFINQTLVSNEEELTFDSNKFDSPISCFITGDAVEIMCNPYTAKADETVNDNVLTKMIKDLADSFNVEIFNELPRINTAVFEPIADMDTLLYSLSLKKRISSTRWNLLADLLDEAPVLENRLAYLKTITRRSYRHKFEQYWVQHRRPELLKNTTHIREFYSKFLGVELTEDSLLRLSVIAPERLRNMKSLLAFYMPNTNWSLEKLTKDQCMHKSFATHLNQSFFSDDAMEAGNLYSQFSLTDCIDPALNGKKLAQIFSLSPLQKRRKLNNISLSDSMHLERCLCGVLSADFLWRFYR